jgi:hypothetical protein
MLVYRYASADRRTWVLQANLIGWVPVSPRTIPHYCTVVVCPVCENYDISSISSRRRHEPSANSWIVSVMNNMAIKQSVAPYAYMHLPANSPSSLSFAETNEDRLESSRWSVRMCCFVNIQNLAKLCV